MKSANSLCLGVLLSANLALAQSNQSSAKADSQDKSAGVQIQLSTGRHNQTHDFGSSKLDSSLTSTELRIGYETNLRSGHFLQAAVGYSDQLTVTNITDRFQNANWIGRNISKGLIEPEVGYQYRMEGLNLGIAASIETTQLKLFSRDMVTFQNKPRYDSESGNLNYGSYLKPNIEVYRRFGSAVAGTFFEYRAYGTRKSLFEGDRYSVTRITEKGNTARLVGYLRSDFGLKMQISYLRFEELSENDQDSSQFSDRYRLNDILGASLAYDFNFGYSSLTPSLSLLADQGDGGQRGGSAIDFRNQVTLGLQAKLIF